MDLKSKIILISGPTASGKSNFAINLAKKIKGEIINADSMQVYKELRILPARPKQKDYEASEAEKPSPPRLAVRGLNALARIGKDLLLPPPPPSALHQEGGPIWSFLVDFKMKIRVFTSIYEYFGVKMIRISSLNFIFGPFNDAVTVHTGHSLLHQVVLTS